MVPGIYAAWIFCDRSVGRPNILKKNDCLGANSRVEGRLKQKQNPGANSKFLWCIGGITGGGVLKGYYGGRPLVRSGV